LEQLVPALRHFVKGRNLCPLLPELQFALAANADRFADADAPANYLRRVQLLAPSDPQLWYLIGQQQLLDELPEQAWQSWRRSLQLADWHLAEILNEASRHLTVEQLRNQVLPADPKLLLAAAKHPSFSEPASEEHASSGDIARSFFLQAALEALEAIQLADWDADRFELAGQIYGELGRKEDAISAYREAVRRQPAQIQWRMQLAKALYDAQRDEDAQQETRLILSRDPKHVDARNLLNLIMRPRITNE
jgi:cytochrome c-type biogenesis protein CcmH/NrfG